MRHNQCAACGSTDNLQYHHLIPRSLGGSDDETNLITLCGGCHAKAHDSKARRWGHKELTRAAMAKKKARGERVGRIPFGMRLSADGVHLEEDPTEQAAIKEARDRKESGLSLRRIAEDLNDNGIVKRDGAKWNHVNLHILFNREQPPSKHP